MVRYWIAVHKRLLDTDAGANEGRWRYRQFTDTGCKIDPGWERGRYSACHDTLRDEASPGDWVFDLVCPQGGKGPRIVRSAFRITSNDDGILGFESYFFLDGQWEEGILLPKRIGAYPIHKKRGEDWVELMDVVDSYTQYHAGERPDSISPTRWDEMIAKTPSV